jgi:hypothetical protein
LRAKITVDVADLLALGSKHASASKRLRPCYCKMDSKTLQQQWLAQSGLLDTKCGWQRNTGCDAS